MVCSACLSSDEFRLSHFRTYDLSPLLTLRYPVRCRRCSHRAHAGLRFAMNLWKSRRRQRQRVGDRGTAQ